MASETSLITLLGQLEAPLIADGEARQRNRQRRPRVVYAVNHALPFSSNGYAVRTHGVAQALVEAGVDVIAVTRPGSPWDRPGFDEDGFKLEHRIDGVRYVHLREPSKAGKTLKTHTILATEAFNELLRVFRPHAVMAASNWHNAMPAALAARQAGLPFFYEVRGFWEISRVSREPGWLGSVGYAQAVAGETAVARAAQRVFTINRLMRDELVQRGVALDTIDLVPNGFAGLPRPNEGGVTRATLGIKSKRVVGYVGSFSAYEGLEDLIEAVARLRVDGVDVALLLVGSSTGSAGLALEGCPESARYRALAGERGLGDRLVLPGRVSPQEAEAFYALLDVVVIPRRPLPVTEIVSPMKPLEAVAHGKRVLLSDVAPLADLADVCPAHFSYFRKGDVSSLTEELRGVLAAGEFSPPKCCALAEMTWAHNIGPMVDVIGRAAQWCGVGGRTG